MNTPGSPPRRATNLHLEAALVDEARWREENREALISCNAWVAERGLPLAKFRMF